MVNNTIIDSALSEFSKASDDAKKHATFMLDMISCGRVPTQNQIQEFDSDISQLQKHYNTIMDYAKQILHEDEIPAEASVEELLTVVENKQKEELEKKVLAACLLLQRFTAVKSYLETYSQALEPYQKQAMALLSEIDNGRFEAVVDSNVIESSNAFMHAMELDDFENAEGLTALETLDKYFSTKIQIGIARKQYYYGEESTETVRSMSHSMPVLQESISSSQPQEQPIVASHDSADTIMEDKTHESCVAISEEIEESIETEIQNTPAGVESNDDSSASSNASCKIAAIANEESKEGDALVEMGQVPHVNTGKQLSDEAGETLTSLNKIKNNKTISASGFKKECKNFSEKAFSLLPLFTNLGALSEKQAFLFGTAMGCYVDDEVEYTSVKNCLISLRKKNILACFEMDGEIVYCLTSYADGCLRKESIQKSKMFAISFGNNSIVSDSKIVKKDLKKVVEYNEVLLNYFYGIKESVSNDDYQTIKSSLLMKNGFYNVAVLFDGKKYICTLYDNVEPFISCEYLLIVGDHIPDNISEKYRAIFLYKEGKVYRFPEIVSDAEQEKSECTDDQNDDIDVAIQTDKIDKEIKTGTNEKAEQSNSNSDIYICEEPKDIISQKQDNDNEIPALDELITTSVLPSDDTFYQLAIAIASGEFMSAGDVSNVVRATMLAYSASLNKGYQKCARLADWLLLATHLPLANYRYTAETVSEAISDCENEFIKLSIYIQSLLIPSSSYDHVLYSMAGETFERFESEFPRSRFMKPLFNKMLAIHDVLPMGFSASVMSHLGNAIEQKQYAETLQNRAKNAKILPRIKTKIKDLPILYVKCFGVGSEIYECMSFIAENKVEEVELVRDVLLQYCEGKNDELVISEEKIATILDTTWDEVNTKNRFMLEYGARDKILREFDSRLLLMKSWIEYVNQSHDSRLDMKRINVLRKEIISLIDKALSEADNVAQFASLLKYVLWFIRNYLTEANSIADAFKEFLYTGQFTMTEEGIPVIDVTTARIKYYEPWRRTLKHIASRVQSKEQAREEIVEKVGSELFDNLHQLALLSMAEGEKENPISESQIRDAKQAAEDRTKKFKENLELAYTYNRISEPEKEKLSTIMEEYKPKFFEAMDFGCWNQFLDALEKEINELAAEKKKTLRRELDARKSTLQEGERSTILDEAEMLLEDAMNFAVTEEYFNRFDNGEREFSDDLYAILHEEDSFATFLSDNVFKPLQQECENHSGRSLKSFAMSYLDLRFPQNWTVRQKDDSRKLVENWPYRKNCTTSNNIKALFTGLGFIVKNVTAGSGRKEEYFQLEVEATAKSMADYRHPISLFGTQMKSPINVVVLYGNYAPKQLVDTITGLDFGGMSIVLIDRPIDRASRRQIGEIFHTQTSGQNPFILIDQILILHLAMYQVTERLPVMLKCTLPYTTYQPFVRDGGSTTDEMFCGRTKELATIIDPNGASVVYGGRQLGKTALLQRAESRRSNPANKDYAVYCNIINCDSEEALVNKILVEFAKKTDLVLENSLTIDDLCKQLDRMFRTNKVRSMLLLLDEADKFLSAIAETKYTQLQPLIDLKRETTNRFKFVLAGLHNVCRAKNATSENGVFGQLGTPLCVKPLSPTDALQLLSRPLKYLGFEIDRYPHLETILTNTNYYPGILQFFGYNLVEAFTTQYGRYYSASDGNPPFTLQDDQLGAVMNDADLNKSIRNKFCWSLELDPRYFMIARCITMLYYLRDEDTENWLGFSVDEIMKVSREYEIHCLEKCARNDYVNLLDEMFEMGILSKPSNGLYRLRRNSFVNIIGVDFDTLDADIINNNVEA